MYDRPNSTTVIKTAPRSQETQREEKSTIVIDGAHAFLLLMKIRISSSRINNLALDENK